jgi:ABC-type glutathione transport system ATPase component
MLDLCRLIFGIASDLLRPQVALEAVILVLRQQINVLRRANPKSRTDLVGESGCGKTTLAKTILGLVREMSGTVWLDEQVVSGLSAQEARAARATIQYVHQDPGAALDPWWSIGHALDEALRIHGVTDRSERRRRVDEMLEAVGLVRASGVVIHMSFSAGSSAGLGSLAFSC